MKYGKEALIMSALLSFCHFSYATTWDLAALGGVNFSSLSNGTQNLPIDDLFVNTYISQRQTVTQAAAGGALHWGFEPLEAVGFSVGPAFYYANLGTLNGTEFPSSNYGVYPSLNYQFSLSSWTAMAEGQLLYTWCAWQPSITVGIGAAWNRLSHYSETPTDPNQSAVAAPFFADNTTTSFAFEAGAGIKYEFYNEMEDDTHYFVGVDYRYFNFGSGSLGPSAIQTASERLTVSTLDTQAVLLSLSVSF